MNVAVVGAGVIGCALAHELASRGADVTVFERRGIARGASWASAGVLAPWIEAGPISPAGAPAPRLARSLAGPLAPRAAPSHVSLLDLCAESLAMYDGFVERVRRDGGAAFEYARTGTLEVAFTSEQAAALERTAHTLQSNGVDARWLDVSETRDLEPALSDRLAGALRIEAHGFVEMPGLVDAIAMAARMRGAVFHVPADVSKIEPAPGGAVRLHAADGAHLFDRIVAAGGSWAKRLRTGETAVRPIKGQLVRLRFDAPPSTRVLWSEGCYMVPWRDGTALVGATMEDVGFDERVTSEATATLLEAASMLVPAARDAQFVDVRAGLRPSPADEAGMPYVGPSPSIPNVTLAIGHFRNGVLLAPLTARLVADAVLG